MLPHQTTSCEGDAQGPGVCWNQGSRLGWQQRWLPALQCAGLLFIKMLGCWKCSWYLNANCQVMCYFLPGWWNHWWWARWHLNKIPIAIEIVSYAPQCLYQYRAMQYSSSSNCPGANIKLAKQHIQIGYTHRLSSLPHWYNSKQWHN